MAMRRFVARVVLCVSAVSVFVSLGCGNGAPWPAPVASVAPTQNPLVAQYNITAPHYGSTAWVEFGEDTNYGRQTSVTATTTGVGQPLTILVAGMKASTTYHMRAHLDWLGGESWVGPDQTFTTGPIPNNLVVPQFAITRPDANLTPQSGVELVDLGGATPNTLEALATDLEGSIIWYYDVGKGNSVFPIRGPLTNGHFLVNVGTALAGYFLREVDLAGNTIRQVTVDQVNQSLQNGGYSLSIANFHHDVLALPNGDWVALCNVSKEFTNLPGYPGVTNVIGDALVDINSGGNVVWAWNAFDHLDVNRHPMFFPDWTHSNALIYTPDDGNLLLSIRHQSWIIKIDYENGKGAGDILWRLGYEGDFQLAGDDPSQWFYAQHFPSIISTTGSQINLAVFDNGDFRVLDSKGDVCGNPTPPCYSRATAFQFDESSKAATLTWAYSPEVYSFWGGGTQQLANGNIEFDMSEPSFTDPTSSIITELTQTSNPAIVWQMNIQGGNAYRGYRIPSLYPGVKWQK
jgi:arylsulfate sulfotransferase